jgi:opacity protein-like surface antigen
MKAFALAALFAAVLISPAQAEEVTMSREFAAGSLHEGALDMVAYWAEVPGGALEVTATFRDRATDDEPMRIVMPMQDGDALAFGMPGYEGALYSFARAGQEVSISVEITPKRLAAVN